MSEKIFIFDNGSVASKLLQHQYKDQYETKVVKVPESESLVKQFTKVENKDKIKIFLPFTVEELADNNEQLRKDIQQVKSLGYDNLIVLPYEGDTKDEIRKRAKIAGFEENSEVLKGEGKISYPNHGGVVTEDAKPYKSVKTEESRDVQNLP